MFSAMSKINHSKSCDDAVHLIRLCKSYDNGYRGKEVVLDNFSMRVKKGTIYGFLGASGCGKTTVLSCIVGLQNWDSGEVLVFGKEPGSKENKIPGKILGYMPQELALYNQLSIIETIIFYGKLYGMSNSAIKKNWNDLRDLVDLSNCGSKLIGELSGGQKRRASLAVAMVHSPQLLILDEPTVGLDPVLRENIWKYLFQIASTLGTTIIITTHYIEEARYSDRIGLMRRGRMVVEESPTEIMKNYKSDLLEQVVMQICRLDELQARNAERFKSKLEQNEPLKFKSSRKLKNEFNVHSDDLKGHFRVLPPDDIEKGYETKSFNEKAEPELKCSNLIQSFKTTWGFTWLIFLCLFRYPVFLITILILPAIQGTITLWVIGSKPINLPLGIINHEVVDWTAACKPSENHSFIGTDIISGCQLTSNMPQIHMSCQYLNQLQMNKVVTLIKFGTEEDALAQVRLGNSRGYMIIPENFSSSLGDILLTTQHAMNESIEGSRIPIYLDYSQFLSRLFIIQNIYTSYFQLMKEIAKSCPIDEKVADLPLNFRKTIYGNSENSYTAFVMPGALVFTTFGIVGSLSNLLLIAADRRQGTLSRATVAGLSRFNVISSHIIVQGFLTIFQLAIWNIVVYIVFSIPFEGEIWLYIFICLLTGLTGTALGIFLGFTLDTEIQALYAGSFLMNVFLFYGGIIWPTEAMTKFWQTAASVLPTVLPTKSLRSVIVRGLGIGHPLVYPGILVSIFWAIVLVILSVIRYRPGT